MRTLSPEIRPTCTPDRCYRPRGYASTCGAGSTNGTCCGSTRAMRRTLSSPMCRSTTREPELEAPPEPWRTPTSSAELAVPIPFSDIDAVDGLGSAAYLKLETSPDNACCLGPCW